MSACTVCMTYSKFCNKLCSETMCYMFPNPGIIHPTNVYFILNSTCLLRCRYHAGSLAFGSLILSLVQIIRVFLEYVDHKLKGQEGIGSPWL